MSSYPWFIVDTIVDPTVSVLDISFYFWQSFETTEPPPVEEDYPYEDNTDFSDTSTTSFAVVLPEDLFSHDNGELLSFAVIITREGEFNKEKHLPKQTKFQNSNHNHIQPLAKH